MTAHPAQAGALDDIIERTRRVPPIHDFPGVDALLASFEELAAAHRDLVVPRRIGTSRLGEPIPMFSVGHGPRQYLLVAGVHPNEPIGFRTLQHLATELCSDAELREAFDATWHLVPCIDPDGTRLNEGWFAHPASRTDYARGFYRPAPDEQVEWTFPFAHKDAWFDRVLPETQALMRVIDEVRPELLVSLHNGELGGVYYYLSAEVPGAVPALHAVAAGLGLPLEAGEPESPALRRWGPAVFRGASAADEYDYLESVGITPTVTSGESSGAYAARHGTVSLVAELPYWSHPQAVDDSPSTLSYRDVLVAKADALIETGRLLGAVLDQARAGLTINSPFLRAGEAFVPVMIEMGGSERERAAGAECDRPATVAEAFSNADLVRCFRLRYGGMLLRALEAEVHAGTATVAVRAAHAHLAAVFDGWAEEADAVQGLTVLDIHRLVGVQIGATLAVARCLADRPAPREAR